MGNLLPKLTQVETTTKESSNKNMEQLKHLAHEFLGINGRQFEALYSCITVEMKDAREQDLARAIHSMQGKMHQNSKETATMLSSVLKREKKVIKDLAANKSNISSEEMQQIEAVKDDIRKLKEGVLALNHQMEMAEDEIKIAKNYVKYTASAMNSKLHMKTEDNYDVGDIRVLKEDVDCVNNEMHEVMEELVSHEHKLEDIQTALNSLDDKLKDTTEELESLKNVATNREKVVTCELRNIKEDLKVVKEKTRGAKDEQRGLTEAGLRKVVTDANLTTESNDQEGISQTDHLQNVRQEMTELQASINCMKRNRDSRYPIFEQNKKLRKQSTPDDEHGIASVSRKIVCPSSTSSSESDSSASALPSKSNLNTNLDFDSDSDSSSRASPLPSKSNLCPNLDFDPDSSDSDSDS